MNDTIAVYGLLDDEDLPTEAAALALSALDHDGADIAPYLEHIDRMAARVLALGAETQTPAGQAAVLARVIARENEFTGDRESYDAPVNGDMMRVFDRRRGLPISLAIIYVAVARRIGWAAYVLNLPGHVLVGIGENEPVLLDAFNRGAMVALDEPDGADAPDDRRGATARLGLRMSNRDVLVRLLQNQGSRAEQGGDHERALTIYDRMKTVAPANPQGWFALVRVQLRIGARAAARTGLISLLEITRDPHVRAQISRALETLAEG